jgi:hypothetical protein
MSLHEQLIWGSVFLTICVVFHTVVLAYGINFLLGMSHKRERHLSFQLFRLAVAILIIVFGHTAQVWMWAGALMGHGIFSDWNTAIYFSLVTYTALGYGDITLTEGARVFAAFAAVTGLLSFGISTAFIAALLSKMLRRVEAVE